MSLAKNILMNVLGTSSVKELWEKLEGICQGNVISNWLLNEQFHNLHMEEHTKDHLSVFNGIYFELETIGVKIDDQDKYLRLIWYLPSSYDHIKPILIYLKETLSFEKVASKLFLKKED